MKYNGVKRDYKNLLFMYLKKHACPKCDNELKTIKVSEIVDSDSERAKDFDFS